MPGSTNPGIDDIVETLDRIRPPQPSSVSTPVYQTTTPTSQYHTVPLQNWPAQTGTAGTTLTNAVVTEFTTEGGRVVMTSRSNGVEPPEVLLTEAATGNPIAFDSETIGDELIVSYSAEFSSPNSNNRVYSRQVWERAFREMAPPIRRVQQAWMDHRELTPQEVSDINALTDSLEIGIKVARLIFSMLGRIMWEDGTVQERTGFRMGVPPSATSENGNVSTSPLASEMMDNDNGSPDQCSDNVSSPDSHEPGPELVEDPSRLVDILAGVGVTPEELVAVQGRRIWQRIQEGTTEIVLGNGENSPTMADEAEAITDARRDMRDAATFAAYAANISPRRAGEPVEESRAVAPAKREDTVLPWEEQ